MRQDGALGLAGGAAGVEDRLRGLAARCRSDSRSSGGQARAQLIGAERERPGARGQVTRAGALVTESVMEQEPLKGLFPQRNRIISGLSRLVVIVQAGADSGALITATHAAEQGRAVLAVPGAVDDEQHAGCNRLIREGAILCRNVEDILEELDGVSAVAARKKQQSTTEAPA